ncbi:hypothetical protein BC829DRAFT_391768 [Chytridium lagenaria]|nr:hypothetical protein BC829DRAFT_391768 [Chytridium lagenaria]
MFLRTILIALAGASIASAVSVPRGQQLLVQDDDKVSSTLDTDFFLENGFRLISTAEGDARWMTEDEILNLIRTQTKFMDVTDGDLSASSLVPPLRFKPPTTPTQQDIVKPLFANVSTTHLESWLTKFTSFKNRYYQSSSGGESAQWLFDQVSELGAKADKVKVTVKKFDHPWPQFSTIARVEALSGAKEDTPIVVVSAHQDSVNQWNPWWGRSPGADDDGSGSVTVFEAYRFHWYAAEEGGLLGSQKVVAKYKADNIAVAGIFHADMTGWKPEGKEEVIALATDFTDKEMTSFVKTLVTTYSSIKYQETKCGYACSDHASWTKAGYASAFTFEADFEDHSPYIHTTNDDVTHIDFDHVAKFTEAVIAFAVELSLAQ